MIQKKAVKRLAAILVIVLLLGGIWFGATFSSTQPFSYSLDPQEVSYLYIRGGSGEPVTITNQDQIHYLCENLSSVILVRRGLGSPMGSGYAYWVEAYGTEDTLLNSIMITTATTTSNPSADAISGEFDMDYLQSLFPGSSQS